MVPYTLVKSNKAYAVDTSLNRRLNEDETRILTSQQQKSLS